MNWFILTPVIDLYYHTLHSHQLTHDKISLLLCSSSYPPLRTQKQRRERK